MMLNVSPKIAFSLHGLLDILHSGRMKLKCHSSEMQKNIAKIFHWKTIVGKLVNIVHVEELLLYKLIHHNC